jgi:hypothetical protein
MPFFPQDVAPFNINIEARVENALVVPDLPGLDPICSAAVYALPDGSGPSWFQLRCATSQIKKDDDGRLNARKAITMQPSSRPEVNWIRIGSL